jgi:S-adenosylmethionine uptake transporter
VVPTRDGLACERALALKAAPLAAPALMVGATALFALMGAAVKAASELYTPGEIVLARSALGVLAMALLMQWRGIAFASPVPRLHIARSVTGVVALCLWFTAIGALPLATAMTLNTMSSVWVAVFVVGALWLHRRQGTAATDHGGVDTRRVAAVLAGFAGVVLVLQPTVAQDQWLHGLVGLASGVLAAVAYLQVSALGRAGEPGERVVFYFSATGVLFGAAYAVFDGGFSPHTPRGVLLLATIGALATAAQWMLTQAFARGATLGIAALQYLGIVFSALLGLLLFREGLSTAAVLGMGLIIVAGVAATGLRGRPRAATPAPGDA